MLKRVTTCAIILFVFISIVQSQDDLRPIETAVPCLTIAPDSRSGAMGDVGVATEPDMNSMHWNPAKYAFIKNKGGVSLSYTPWLRQLVNDIDLAYLTGYYRLNDQQVIAASLLYFSMGTITFRDSRGEYIRDAIPNEFSIDAAYARQFSNKLSGGLAFRYIRSDLSSGVSSTGVDTKAGQAFAADISVYYKNDVKLSDKDGNYALGLCISNIGNRISYTEDTKNKDFIPINMRLGGAFTVNMDEYNSFTFALDLNKMLVPTRPIYFEDSTLNGRPVVKYGKDPNVGVVEGMFQSFYDAPGEENNGKRSVLKEELHEITYSVGLEYWYRKQFALRGGYFYEHPTKGNRKFFALGLGVRLNVFGLDFAYLIPTYANNPLANTLRFSLNFELGADKKNKNQ